MNGKTNTISPRPLIAHVAQTWRVAPGMVYAVVQDIERQIWIVESCPVGTQFWTVAQASELRPGLRTRHALTEAVKLGRSLLKSTANVRQEAPGPSALPIEQPVPATLEAVRPVVREGRPLRTRTTKQRELTHA